jgi:uncharacterized protein (TIGR03435 family)
MTRMLLSRMLLATSTSIELTVLVKVTILLVSVLLVDQTAKTARASVRHLVLAATFGVLATLPLVTVAMPPVQVGLPVSVVDVSGQALPSVIPPGTRSVHNAAPVQQQVGQTRQAISLAGALRAVWALGLVVCLAPVFTAFLRLRRLRRTGLPWLDIRLPVQYLALEAGIARRVEVLLHEDVPVPMTAGWRRPTILLPVDMREWSELECRNALVHELEHVRRADWAIHVVGRLVCGLYWFHPLVWTAWHRMALDAEHACDDAVLRCADGPTYATQLVNLAARHSNGTAPALAMANRSDLAARVSSILNAEQPRGRTGRWAGATIAVVAILVAVTLSPLRAGLQAPPAVQPQTHKPAVAGAKPAFDVVSIKRHNPDDHTFRFDPRPGGIDFVNLSLRELIFRSYQTQNYRLVGGENWLKTETWDIQAKGEGLTALPIYLASVRQLLADRFKLVMHLETRELPIYRLVKARSDGKLGPQVKPSTCKPLSLDVHPDTPGACLRFLNQANGTLSETRNTFRGLANQLGQINVIARPVVDATGLTDEYEFMLKWTPEANVRATDGTPLPPATVSDATPTGDRRSIFTALEEQLGLKLEATRGPIEVLVIDSAERPTEN